MSAALRPAQAATPEPLEPAGLAAALRPFAAGGHLPLLEAAGHLLVREIVAGRRPVPLPPHSGRRDRLAGLCLRTARRVLSGQTADPFPTARYLRHRDARGPAGCPLLGERGDFLFFAPRGDG